MCLRPQNARHCSHAPKFDRRLRLQLDMLETQIGFAVRADKFTCELSCLEWGRRLSVLSWNIKVSRSPDIGRKT